MYPKTLFLSVHTSVEFASKDGKKNHPRQLQVNK